MVDFLEGEREKKLSRFQPVDEIFFLSLKLFFPRNGINIKISFGQLLTSINFLKELSPQEKLSLDFSNDNNRIDDGVDVDVIN